MGPRLRRIGTGLLLMSSAASASADTGQFVSVADNTLIEAPSGSAFVRSDGAGPLMFLGNTLRDGRRRMLLRFDLSAVPAGSVITDARLKLNLSRLRARPSDPATPVSVWRVSSSWGEAGSYATGGVGDVAQVGDATWLHRFCGAPSAAESSAGVVCGSATSQFWVQEGGDYAAAPSATVSVPNVPGTKEWAGSGLVADVQSWINAPTVNHGWLLSDEDSSSAKALSTREAPDPASRPLLVLTWTPPTVAPSVDAPLPPWALAGLAAGLMAMVRRARRPADRSSSKTSRQDAR